jgi:DNA helicase-2/ATP-dependent DNA helicase PcrA
MDILDQYDNIQVKNALQHIHGPLLINAGPGSGKTRFLTTRVAYLLINKIVKINEIIVCTFTEKAAINLKNKITELLLKYSPETLQEIKLEKLRIGTIHSIFLNLLEENIHFTNLSTGYTVLNELERKLFIFNNLDKFNFKSFTIPVEKNKFKTFYEFETTAIFNEHIESWDLTDYLCKFYDTIVDQGAEVYGLDNLLKKINNEDYIKLIESYIIYKNLLLQNNYLDFTQIQNAYWELINNDSARFKIRSEISHLLVDEYQDTNFIQEVCLLESIGEFGGITNVINGEKYPTKNVTVVGDFNQSLYRFRGANIDNILTFQNKFSQAVNILKLFKNYRSTQNIISLSNNYIDKNLKFYETKNYLQKLGSYFIELGVKNHHQYFLANKSKLDCL